MDQDILNETSNKMVKALESLEKRFSTVRAGRANPSSLDGVVVDYYGTPTPLKQLATISVPDARQLVIKPFDKSCLADIEKQILVSELGYTPNNDGETIRIVIPVLTEERRKELTKQVKAMSEDAKVQIRNVRQDSLNKIKRDDFSEDEEKGLEKEVQELVNTYNKRIEELLKAKEQDLLTV